MLNDQQARNLKAFAARVVPDDDGTPGAIIASVDMHLRAMLVRDLAPDLPGYQQVLDALGEDFARCPAQEQDARMHTIEQSDRHRKAFRRMVEHVQEGFYISPIAWRLIGWEVTG